MSARIAALAALVGLSLVCCRRDNLHISGASDPSGSPAPGSPLQLSGVGAVRELGIPVRSVSWVQLYPGTSSAGKGVIYAAMGQESAPFFVLEIDPESGVLRQFDAGVEKANFPTAGIKSSSGRLYFGSAYAGHLHCFDPRESLLLDLGPIHEGAADFPCRIDEAADGTLWIGSYGTADLTSYDPRRGEFTHHGRMDEVDMYNYPLVNIDGTIACRIGVTRSFIVVFDPRTGQRRQVGPIAVQGEDRLDLYRGGDDRLYIVSTLGNFRLDGITVVEVDELPAPPPRPALPDGTSFSFADATEQVNRTLRLQGRVDGQTRLLELDYEASGSRIFYLHAGPDGMVYGSSVMPLHLFSYDLVDGQVKDLGRCSTATGEAYSMANLDGVMYISSYPQAVLSVYDSQLPYDFGDGEAANPRDLGRIDELSTRPRSTLAGPLGRVWTASLPDYGRWGGPLSWYDPATDQRHAYLRLAGDGSCYTLAWLAELGLIAVGTSVEGGTGTTPRLERAGLFLWDYEKEEKVWEGSPAGEGVRVVNTLIVTADRSLWGTYLDGLGNGFVFRFDPATRTFTDYMELAEPPIDHGLVMAPDHSLYGFTLNSVYRLSVESMGAQEKIAHEEIAHREGDFFLVAGPVVGNEILFASNHRLMAVQIAP